jgi:hypothetical protein
VDQLQEFFKSLLTRRESGLPAYSGAVSFFTELQRLKKKKPVRSVNVEGNEDS